MPEPVHYCPANKDRYKTPCGEYVDDVEKTSARREYVTCQACLEYMPVRTFSIKNCKACGAEFTFMVRKWDTAGPSRCKPCVHASRARLYEQNAAKFRRKASEAVGPRDRHVAEIKRRGWTTIPAPKRTKGA